MQGQAGHDVIAIIMAMLYKRSAGRYEAPFTMDHWFGFGLMLRLQDFSSQSL